MSSRATSSQIESYRPHSDFVVTCSTDVVAVYLRSSTRLPPHLHSVTAAYLKYIAALHSLHDISHRLCLHCIEQTKIGRLPACVLQHNRALANNGRPNSGKTEGSNPTAATSRVLPEESRRQFRDYILVVFQLARKENNKVAEGRQETGGGRQGQNKGQG